MEEIINKAVEQLEQKAERLKAELRQERDLNQALQELERMKEELIESIKSLVEVGMPSEIIEFYVKHRGNVWASKRFAVEYTTRPELRLGSWMPLHTTEIEAGLYKFLLLAVPIEAEPDSNGFVTDDYNHRVRLGDC